MHDGCACFVSDSPREFLSEVDLTTPVEILRKKEAGARARVEVFPGDEAVEESTLKSSIPRRLRWIFGHAAEDDVVQAEIGRRVREEIHLFLKPNEVRCGWEQFLQLGIEQPALAAKTQKEPVGKVP